MSDVLGRIAPSFDIPATPCETAEQKAARERRATEAAREKREMAAAAAVAGAVQPRGRSTTLPGNVTYGVATPGDITGGLAPPGPPKAPFFQPEARSYETSPTQAEALRALAAKGLPPEEYGRAVELLQGQRLLREPEVPEDIEKERKTRIGAIAMSPGATAEQVARGAAEGVKGVPFDPDYAKRQQFLREVQQGKYGDPRTPEGRLAVIDAALARDLPDVAKDYQARPTLRKEAAEEAQRATARTTLLPKLGQSVARVQGSQRLTDEEKAWLQAVYDTAEADPSPKNITAVNRAIAEFAKVAQRREETNRRLSDMEKRTRAIEAAKTAQAKRSQAVKVAAEIRQRIKQIVDEKTLADPLHRRELEIEQERLTLMYNEILPHLEELAAPEGGATPRDGVTPPPAAPSGAPSNLNKFLKTPAGAPRG